MSLSILWSVCLSYVSLQLKSEHLLKETKLCWYLNLVLSLKVTSATKLFFCQKVALDAQLMNFSIWRRNVSFSRYLVLVFVKSEIHKFQNLGRHHRHCYIMAVTLLLIFIWILSTIKMNFGQIIVCCMINISNMFCSMLETGN